MLNNIAQCDELFHTASGTAFADIIIAGHRETWPIRSKRFRAFSSAAITTRPGRPRARPRFGQRSIC
jgi:hypothetical protein